jgi:hypothetical protein
MAIAAILVAGILGLALVPFLEKRLRLVGELTEAQVRRRRFLRLAGGGILALLLVGARAWTVTEPDRSGAEADRGIATAEADLRQRLRSVDFTRVLVDPQGPLAGAPITSAEIGPTSITTRTEVRVGTVVRCLVVHAEPGAEPRAEHQDGRCR